MISAAAKRPLLGRYASPLTTSHRISKIILEGTSTRCISGRSDKADAVKAEQTTSADATAARPGAPNKTVTIRRRSRHRFDSLSDIPSFHDFQQQQQVRSVYRKFLRLVYSIDSDNDNGRSREELLLQVRRQFRAQNRLDPLSSWDMKRAISEANMRLKEVTAMLGNVVESKTRASRAETADTTTPVQNLRPPSPPATNDGWPWHKQSSTGPPKRPSPFPKKTGL